MEYKVSHHITTTVLKMPLDISLESFNANILFAGQKHSEFASVKRIGTSIQAANFDEDSLIVAVFAGITPGFDLPLEIFERDLDIMLAKDMDVEKISWQVI